MTVLRWGILSTGMISRNFTKALRLLPHGEHEVVAVAARKLESAQEFAKDLNIPTSYGSYEELVKNRDVDIVYVGTIHPYHLQLTKLALNSGKHVLCEKPLGMNKSQVQEMVSLAQEKGLFLMEGLWSRFFPAYECVQQHIKDDTIGEVQFVQAAFGQHLLEVERCTELELGGGSILDLGVYAVQFACFIFGEKPIRIEATGEKLENGADLWATITLVYSDNRVAQLTCHMGVELTHQATVHGTRGSLTIPYFWCPSSVVTAAGTLDFQLPVPEEKLEKELHEGFVYEQACVRDCILKGLKECPKVTHDDSLLIAEIMDEARRQLGVKYPADD